MRKVQGVGINDVTYQTDITEWVNGKQKLLWRCPFQVKWKGMLRRCYSEEFLIKNPSYRDCEVAEGWKTFSNFRKWVCSQGIKEEELCNYDLDKDILGDGFLYSEETCVLIPHVINTFILDKRRQDSPHPVGVYFHNGKYIARCNDPIKGIRLYLGGFDDPHVAHQAWLSKKLEILEELQSIHKVHEKVTKGIAQLLSKNSLDNKPES